MTARIAACKLVDVLKHLATLTLVAGLFLACQSADLRAEDAAEPAKPKCEIAEVNPVTGHAICIKPIGAPVEPPPPQEEELGCDPGDASKEDWSWSSKCRPTKPGA